MTAIKNMLGRMRVFVWVIPTMFLGWIVGEIFSPFVYGFKLAYDEKTAALDVHLADVKKNKRDAAWKKALESTRRGTKTH